MLHLNIFITLAYFPMHSLENQKAATQYLFPQLPSLLTSDADLDAIAHFFELNNAATTEGTVPAGYTYFGQFIAHDLSVHKPQFDTYGLNLDSVYGIKQPFDTKLFELAAGKIKFRLGSKRIREKVSMNQSNLEGLFEVYDLPKIGNQFLIADSRNKEHILITQFHLVFLLLHNKLIEATEEPCPLKAFHQTRKKVTSIYRYLILTDFLPNVLCPQILKATIAQKENRFSPGTHSQLPFEFMLAAFRFGHSMVKKTYDFSRLDGTRNPPLSLFELDSQPDWIDWQDFFPESPSTATHPLNFANAIAPTIIQHLQYIPNHKFFIEHEVAKKNLLKINLQRGIDKGLPSGQAIAELFPTIPTIQVVDLPLPHHLKTQTPLWLYLLYEASQYQDSHHGKLGPLGSKIVSEVLVGLLKHVELSLFDKKEAALMMDGFRINCMADVLRWVGAYRGAFVRG